jgi:hypothetical protein
VALAIKKRADQVLGWSALPVLWVGVSGTLAVLNTGTILIAMLIPKIQEKQ